MSTLNENITIKQAKDIMRPLLRTGCTCPACGQPVRMYSRSITSSMAYGLILLFRAERMSDQPGKWIHLENYFKNIPNVPASVRGDVPKLRFWGLIQHMNEGKDDGNPMNGYYRITAAGMRFVEGKETTMSHIQLYNNKAYGYPKESKPITIQQALKNKFDYSKLMEL